MKLSDILKSNYQFTPYITEIAVMLNNPMQTLILCNLINKLTSYNEDVKINRIYGKDYHFKRNQSFIFKNELGVPRQTFTDNIKQLSDYVSYFDGKDDNESGYNTTFYYLNLEAIRNLFDKGKTLLGNKTKVVQPESKVYKKPYQSSNNSSFANIDNYLNKINALQTKLNNKEIDNCEFNCYFQPLKMKLQENKVSIKLNNNIKLWEKI